MTYQSYIPSLDSDHVKATSAHVSFPTYQTCDPDKNLDGSWDSQQWLTASGAVSEIKFNVDLGFAYKITRIYLENSHNTAGYLTTGIKNFSVYGSNSSSALDDTVYSSTANLTLLGTFLAAQHVAINYPTDPQYFTFSNDTTYRYYVLRIADNYGSTSYLGIRRLEFQKDNATEISGTLGLTSPETLFGSTGIAAAKTLFNGILNPENLKLLIHSNTYNMSTELIDSSGNVPPIDVYFVNESGYTGSHSTGQHKFGTSCIRDYLEFRRRIEVDYDFGFSDNDFVIDFWVWPAGLDATPLAQAIDSTSGVFRIFFATWNANVNFTVFTDLGTFNCSGSYSGKVSLNTWSHVAAKRVGSTISILLNGSVVGTTEVGAAVINNATVPLKSGLDTANPSNVMLDEIRISVGESFDFSVPAGGIPTDAYQVGPQMYLTAPGAFFSATDGNSEGSFSLTAPSAYLTANDGALSSMLSLYANGAVFGSDSVGNTSGDLTGTMGLIAPTATLFMYGSFELRLTAKAPMFSASGTVGRTGILGISTRQPVFDAIGSCEMIANMDVPGCQPLFSAIGICGNAGVMGLYGAKAKISMNGLSVAEDDSTLTLSGPGAIMSMTSKETNIDQGMFRYLRGRIE